jgi:hypothetical protein
VIAAIPGAVAFAVALGVVAGWAAGRQPFWPTPDLTLSEAAALRDLGEVYRLTAYEGADPNRAWPVRAGLLPDNRPAVISPLAAAVESRRFEMVRLLVHQGASPPAAERVALICRADALGEPAIVGLLLTTGDQADPRPACGASGTP